MSGRPAIPARRIAEFLGSRLLGSAAGGGEPELSGVAPLDRVAPRTLSFAKQLTPERIERIRGASGAVVLVPAGLDSAALGFWHIPCASPRSAFAKAVAEFFVARPSGQVSPRASVHPTARLAKGVTVGDHSVIGPEAEIGEGTEIRHNVTIGPRVRIGRNCLIKSNTVIGEEGFGIDTDEAGNNIRVPHLGSAIIGDFVELGALNTVCSGTLDPTLVGNYVKTDDHVHIAHNCRIGDNCIITACSEISGSVDIGAETWLGPNCSIMNKISIGKNVMIGLGAVVTKSVPDDVVAAGSPARVLGPRKTRS